MNNSTSRIEKTHRFALVGIIQKRRIRFLATRRPIFPTSPIVIVVIIVSRRGVLVSTIVFVEDVVTGGFFEFVEVGGDAADQLGVPRGVRRCVLQRRERKQ